MKSGPLAGLRVLELATLYSAPQIGAMLGDLGADVVKVEPPAGDPMRRMGVAHDGVSRNWLWVSRNKRSAVLDLDRGDDDRTTFDGLVRAADVLIENLDAKTRARWHCTYDELAARNPRLVVVSVTCYGLDGPYADRPGAGTLAEAFGGLTHMSGATDGPPMLTSVPIGDTLTAFSGVIGALAACWWRDARAGTGQHVDVTMYEPILQLVGGTIATWDGEHDPPARSGSRVHGGVPRNVYRTRDDEWVAVSGTTDAQVARVLGVIGRDTPADRERFGTGSARLAVADELDGLVAAWVAAHDRDEVVSAFLQARVPIAPVQDVRDIVADPQVRARGSVVSVGGTSMAAPAPHLSVTPGSVRTAGPELGADTEAVIAQWCGGQA